MGRTGILFAAVGLGRYGAALGNRADNAVGGSLGYQMFFKRTRQQLIVELGGRKHTNNRVDQMEMPLQRDYVINKPSASTLLSKSIPLERCGKNVIRPME